MMHMDIKEHVPFHSKRQHPNTVRYVAFAVIVLAFIGTALAFGVKVKFGHFTFCTKAWSSGPGLCAGFLKDCKETTSPTEISFYAFRTLNSTNCTSEQCDVVRTLTFIEF